MPPIACGTRAHCFRHAVACGTFCLVFVAICPFVLAGGREHASSGRQLPTVECGAGFAEMTKDLSRHELDLLEECGVHLKRLEAFYGNVTIDAINRNSDSPNQLYGANPNDRRTTSYRYCSNGGNLFRMAIVPLDGVTKTPQGASRVYMVGPTHCFLAKQVAPNRGLVIMEEYLHRDDAVDVFFTRAFPWTPHRFRGVPAARFIFDEFVEGWCIEHVTTDVASGVHIASIVAQGPSMSAGKPRVKRGTFVFLRDLSWALKEFTIGDTDISAKDAVVRRGAFEYTGDKDGIPLLKRVTYWDEQGHDKRRSTFEEYEVTRLVPGSTNEQDFLPSALDIAFAEHRVDWRQRALFFAGVLILSALVLFGRRPHG